MISRNVNNIGIVGFGSFGKFLAGLLNQWFGVTVCDVVDRSLEAKSLRVGWGTLEEVAQSDVVVLSVPLRDFESLLQKMACSNIKDRTLVIEVCSVKQEPIRLMRKYLPRAYVASIHPLFGPASAKNGLRGHKIVVCSRDHFPHKLGYLLALGSRAGLRVIEMTPEEHDREMAPVQGLSHFIARGLAGCGVRQSAVATAAFNKLCEVVELLGGDSWELFCTIQNGNPFAAEIRQKFMEELQNLERRLME